MLGRKEAMNCNSIRDLPRGDHNWQNDKDEQKIKPHRPAYGRWFRLRRTIGIIIHEQVSHS
jgi:hypothetical protein